MVEVVLSLSGAPLPQFDEPIRAPFGHAPLRPPGSVRRTSTIDAVWPNGADGVTELFGTARDYLTPVHGNGRVIVEDRVHCFAEKRKIRTIESTPPRVGIEALEGASAGSYLRSAIEDVLPAELRRGTPLYLLLDDLAGATLVAGWAHSRWPEDPLRPKLQPRVMEGVCIGFRPGSGALTGAGTPRRDQNATPVLPLVNPDDPDGWHEIVDRGGVNFRRARRIDIWRDDTGCIRIDAGFQDSGSSPTGQRVAIHEYHVSASAETSGRLASIRVNPGTLPFAECRAAPVNVDALLGVPLSELRGEVLARLHKTFGCTHLNDTLRSLAEAPILAAALPH